MLLGVLKHIFILGDSLDLEVIALHFFMQRQKVKGVMARAPRLEVRKEVLRRDFSVERLSIPELWDPCVGNDGEDELCRLPSHYLVRRAVRVIRFMRRLCSCAENGRSVVVD